MYWKQVQSEAWVLTRNTLRQYRRVLAIVILVVSAIIFAFFVRAFHLSYPIVALFALVSPILGFLLTTFAEFSWHFYQVPARRDAQQMKAIADRDATIAKLHEMMAGPDLPLLEVTLQAQNVYRLLRQVIRLGHHVLWLSELLAFDKSAFPDFFPKRGQINYPEALKELFRQNPRWGEVIEARQHPYVDFYGKRFDEDIKFRIGSAVT